MKQKDPEAADVQVGINIRQLRIARGLSQTAVADKIGVSFQQIQKYEKGQNRVAGSRLMQIAELFNIKVESLFTGIVQEGDGSGALPGMSIDAVKLANDFDAIEDPAIRLTIRGLVKSLSRQLATHAA